MCALSRDYGICIQKRGGVSDQKNKLEAFPCSVCLSARVPNIHEAKNLPLVVQDKECLLKICCFKWDPPSVYLGRHWCHSRDKSTRPSHSGFAYCNWSKTERWEGLGTGLYRYGNLPKYIHMDEWLHKKGVGVFLRQYSNVNTSVNQISLLNMLHTDKSGKWFLCESNQIGKWLVKKTLRSSQDSNLCPPNSSQMFLPTEPLELWHWSRG